MTKEFGVMSTCIAMFILAFMCPLSPSDLHIIENGALFYGRNTGVCALGGRASMCALPSPTPLFQGRGPVHVPLRCVKFLEAPAGSTETTTRCEYYGQIVPVGVGMERHHALVFTKACAEVHLRHLDNQKLRTPNRHPFTWLPQPSSSPSCQQQGPQAR
jgi:hypothetical protein